MHERKASDFLLIRASTISKQPQIQIPSNHILPKLSYETAML